MPQTGIVPGSKGGLALAELDRMRAVGVRFGIVLGDARYDASAGFRHGLDKRGLRWMVGIPRNQKVCGVRGDPHPDR